MNKKKKMMIGFSLSAAFIVAGTTGLVFTSNNNPKQVNAEVASSSAVISSKSSTVNSSVIISTSNSKTEETTSSTTEASSETTTSSTQEETFGGTEGTYGRIYIPTVGVEVAVNTSSYDSSDAQAIMDQEDSAVAMVNWDGGPGTIISDHREQGFIAITGLQVGDVVYLKQGGVVIKYVCDQVGQGARTDEGYIYNSDGVDITTMSDLTLYTCNPDAAHPFIAHLVPTN